MADSRLSAFVCPAKLVPVWEAYKRHLGERPVVTKTLTGAAFFTTSSLLVQWINRDMKQATAGDEDAKCADGAPRGFLSALEERVRRLISPGHIAVFALWGALTGPITHHWQAHLNSRFGAGSSLLKLLFDHVAFRTVMVAAFVLWVDVILGPQPGSSSLSSAATSSSASSAPPRPAPSSGEAGGGSGGPAGSLSWAPCDVCGAADGSHSAGCPGGGAAGGVPSRWSLTAVRARVAASLKKQPGLQVAAAQMWPATQLAGLTYVQPAARSLYNSVVLMAWGLFVTLRAKRMRRRAAAAAAASTESSKA